MTSVRWYEAKTSLASMKKHDGARVAGRNGRTDRVPLLPGIAGALALCTLAACSSEQGDPLPSTNGEAGMSVPVPFQLRMIDARTLRLEGTINGQPFALTEPDGDGRWVLRAVVPPGVPIRMTMTWTGSDGLPLASYDEELPAVERDGPLRVGTTSYSTVLFDEDGDTSPNVEELRCGTDPYDGGSVPSAASGDCGAVVGGGGALDRLRADGRFALFVDAIGTTGKQGLLGGENTVFAPTDAAFRASLADRDIDQLFGDSVALSRLVDRHVVPNITVDGAALAGLVDGTITADPPLVVNDFATPTSYEASDAGGLDYLVEADPGGGSVAAGARVAEPDLIVDGGVVVHRVESLVSVDHALVTDYANLPGDFSDNCFEGQNPLELPRESSRLSYTLREGNVPTVRNDITLTERGRIIVRQLEGLPVDTGAALYDSASRVVAADDDSGRGRAYDLRSTVLEPGRYCLVTGHFLGSGATAPPGGWEGEFELETITTFGVD